MIIHGDNLDALKALLPQYSMRNDTKGIAVEIEHILVYSKRGFWQPRKLERTSGMNQKYKNTDNDPRGAWRNIVASAPNAITHQGMVYAIQNPMTGDYAYPPKGRCWSLGQDQMFEAMNQWAEYKLKDIHDEGIRDEICGVSTQDIKKDVCAIVLNVEQHGSLIHPSSEERLLALLKTDPRMTIPRMAQQLGLGERQVRRLIASLKEKGKIKREGSNKFGCWIVVSMS